MPILSQARVSYVGQLARLLVIASLGSMTDSSGSVGRVWLRALKQNESTTPCMP
jgi:hypothetical protein